MRSHGTARWALAVASMIGGASWIAPGDARACGGCFHEPNPSESTVVTDHRMAFAISSSQTVLWDQVQYTGNPQDFVWVLPVHPGTQVQLSHDEWIAALDASTRPIINPPPQTFSGGFGEGSMSGCGCGSAESTSALDSNGGKSASPPVDVISQTTVGPYETVTLRSTDPQALETWLVAHGYDIPASVRPVIDAYTSEGFDFIALRLRPGQGVRAMQPVRVVTPGADASLPLRMVAAGVGQNVGLTLYVLGEGRYEAENFPNALLDEKKLTWDFVQNRSNYQTLVTGLMALGGGRTWVTEHAKRPSVFTSAYDSTSPKTPKAGPLPATGNPGLADAYFAQCGAYAPSYTFQAADGGGDADTDAGDASADAPSDASADAPGDASGADGGDAGAPDGGACVGACCDFDDLDVAMTGLHSTDVVLTRLRAYLPVDALKAGDLRLIASKDQANVENVHTAVAQGQAPAATGAGLAPTKPSRLGTIVTIGAALLVTARLLRRRRRP